MTRGIYGNKRAATSRPLARVGAGEGSVLGHTPGDVADELDELNSEVMTFDAELTAYEHKINGVKPSDELARCLQQVPIDKRVVDGWRPLRARVEQIQKDMEAAADSSAFLMDLRDAQLAFERFMPREQRVALVRRMQTNAERIWALRDTEALQRDPQLVAYRAAWDEWKWKWMQFHSQKTSIAFQTLPFSGTWDRIQEYRKQFINFVKEAPFPVTMSPLDAESRKDPSILGGIGDAISSLGTLGKVVVYGGLGLIGAIAITSVVQQVRKNKDPLETYAQILKSLPQAAARATPQGKAIRAAQRALPSGED